MAVRSIILSAYGAVLLCAIIAPAIPQNVQSSRSLIEVPQKRSDTLGIAREAAAGKRDDTGGDGRDEDEGEDGIPPLPERAVAPSLRNPKTFSEPVGPWPSPRSARRDGGDEDDDEDSLVPFPARAVPPSLRNPKMFSEPVGPPPPSRPAGRGDDEEDEDEQMDRAAQEQSDTATDEGPDGIPPLPPRAVPPSLRSPKVFSEPVGPPSPPQTWSEEEIADAQAECKTLLAEADFDFSALSPIRDGACGAPAPVQLKGLKRDMKVELHPPATMTCPLASALGRWMSEVVQPRAKALLETEITQIADLSAYQCRPRYNDLGQRISHHAFAEAVDIAAFVTAKGETVSVLEHWPGTDKRAQFLKEIHDGACKIFGTVLGPGANAAHKNHFHLDMAKRRHSAFCE
jgi:hypothetical protein